MVTTPSDSTASSASSWAIVGSSVDDFSGAQVCGAVDELGDMPDRPVERTAERVLQAATSSLVIPVNSITARTGVDAPATCTATPRARPAARASSRLTNALESKKSVIVRSTCTTDNVGKADVIA
jgi:hypothetical protein